MAWFLPGRLKLLPLSIACCVPEGCLARRPPTGVGSPLPWTCSLSPGKDRSGLSGRRTSVRKGLAPRGNAPHRSSSLELLAEVGGADCGSGLLLGLTEARGAWHGPSHLMFPDPPPPAPLLPWGMPRDCPAVGLSHPPPLNFLPTPRPFCPHVQRPRPLGLEFSRDHPWALTPGLAEGQSSALKPCSAVFKQACGVSTAPSPFAVLFALTGTMDGCRWWGVELCLGRRAIWAHFLLPQWQRELFQLWTLSAPSVSLWVRWENLM